MKQNGKHVSIHDRLVEILSHSCEINDISDATTLEELGFDSIDVVELAIDCEAQFEIKEGIFDDHLEMSSTVGNLKKLIEEHQGVK